jgi:Tfp pilus assembly protein PilO
MSASPSPNARVIGVFCALLGAVVALYLVSEAWSAREHAEVATNRLKKELEYKQRTATSHPAYLSRFVEEKALLADIVERLPSHLDEANLQKRVRDLADQAGVHLEWQLLEKESVKEFYGQAIFNATVQGPLPAITFFLDGFARQPPQHSVAQIRIERVDDSGIMRAIVPATFYRYVEDEK